MGFTSGFRSGPAVTAELRKTATVWQPGDIRGTCNQAIDEELALRVRQELVSLATHLPLTSDECGQDALNRSAILLALAFKQRRLIDLRRTYFAKIGIGHELDESTPSIEKMV
jgi:hypothetical protein